jgi:hypothetical protein
VNALVRTLLSRRTLFVLLVIGLLALPAIAIAVTDAGSVPAVCAGPVDGSELPLPIPGEKDDGGGQTEGFSWGG